VSRVLRSALMRLWLSKNSEVPPREQLATQVMLGILSEDLKPPDLLHAAQNRRNVRIRTSLQGRSIRKGMVVIADSLMAPSIAAGCRLHVFRLIADSSISDLRAFVQSLP